MPQGLGHVQSGEAMTFRHQEFLETAWKVEGETWLEDVYECVYVYNTKSCLLTEMIFLEPRFLYSLCVGVHCRAGSPRHFYLRAHFCSIRRASAEISTGQRFASVQGWLLRNDRSQVTFSVPYPTSRSPFLDWGTQASPWRPRP